MSKLKNKINYLILPALLFMSSQSFSVLADYSNYQKPSDIKSEIKEDVFTFQNQFFKLKVPTSIPFQKRYALLETIQETHAIGTTEIKEDGSIVYNGVFGKFKTVSDELFRMRIDKNKRDLTKNIKTIDKHKVAFAVNAKKYESRLDNEDLLKIVKETNVPKGSLIILYETEQNGQLDLMALAVDNKKQLVLKSVSNYL